MVNLNKVMPKLQFCFIQYVQIYICVTNINFNEHKKMFIPANIWGTCRQSVDTVFCIYVHNHKLSLHLFCYTSPNVTSLKVYRDPESCTQSILKGTFTRVYVLTLCTLPNKLEDWLQTSRNVLFGIRFDIWCSGANDAAFPS